MKLLTSLFGIVSSDRIEDYLNYGGYSGLRKALLTKPKILIQELIDAGLRGRGGAGFPTGMKWKFVQQSESDQKYVICNADEGEPGTFKDRMIMEQNPHLLLEGLIISAYCTGADKGYIYIRGEYTDSIQTIKKAIDDAYSSGFLGTAILNSSFSLDLEIKIGAGSYLCGEELTLIESLEGKRGHPRIKPPFPAQKGVFGKPTLVNNVETLANVPFIISKGSKQFKRFGTETAPGTKMFTVSGDVINPGMHEVELGTPLKDIITLCGGIKEGKAKAFLLGGAAGTFIPASMDDIQMDYDSLAEKGATLGSGAIIVMNDSRTILQMLNSILRFFKHESCGKCVPCRVGCKQLLEIMNEMESGNKKDLYEKLQAEAEYIARNSLCPLGQSPILSIRTAIKHFKNELISQQ